MQRSGNEGGKNAEQSIGCEPSGAPVSNLQRNAGKKIIRSSGFFVGTHTLPHREHTYC